MQTHANNDGSEQVYVLRLWWSEQDKSGHASLESVEMSDHRASLSTEDFLTRYKRLDVFDDSILYTSHSPHTKRLPF